MAKVRGAAKAREGLRAGRDQVRGRGQSPWGAEGGASPFRVAVVKALLNPFIFCVISQISAP